MCILSFTKFLNELDRIIVNDVYVGDTVRTLESVREFVETYYKVKDKNNVFEVFRMVNYTLGNIELDYIKKNHLNDYGLLRLQILNWRWDSLDIDHRCVRGDDNDEEDIEDNIEEREDKEIQDITIEIYLIKRNHSFII